MLVILLLWGGGGGGGVNPEICLRLLLLNVWSMLSNDISFGYPVLFLWFLVGINSSLVF